MSYFDCLPTINALRLLLTVPWIGLKFVIVVLPDHTHFFIGQFMRVWYLSHKRSSKDQTRLHFGPVSPEPLQITLKRKDVDEDSSQIL